MAGEGVNLAADLAQFAADTDAEYVSKFFIPGMRKAGDFHRRVRPAYRRALLVFNASPQFPSDWARQAAKAAGGTLDLRTGMVAEADLVAWLAPAERRTSR